MPFDPIMLGLIGQAENNGSGGPVSWNDVTDKPFGETLGDTLTWDGSSDGHTVSTMGHVKVSDAVPTKEDLVNGIVFNIGEVIEITGAEAQGLIAEDGFFDLDGIICFAPTDNYSAPGGVFPEAGIYIASFGGVGCSMTIPGFNKFKCVKTIDRMYLPSGVWAEQSVVYTSHVDGVKRIFKDVECTEMLTHLELYNIAISKKRLVVVDGNGCYDAIAVQYSIGCIVYLESTNAGEVNSRVAWDDSGEPIT